MMSSSIGSVWRSGACLWRRHAVGSGAAVPLGTARLLSTITARRDSVQTAAAVVIGDELLNGSISDLNIPVLARFLYGRGVQLQRVEIITDQVPDIVSTIRRVRETVDVVFTTGGIGPTHDDRTYEALAEAYDTQLEVDQPTADLLKYYLDQRRSEGRPGADLNPARLRMATLPAGSEKLRADGLWVPLVVLGGETFVFPGVPSIFNRMLDSFEDVLPRNQETAPMVKVNLHTRVLEGDIAVLLAETEAASDGGVVIGSYPESSGPGRSQTRVCIQGKRQGAVDEAVRRISSAIETSPSSLLE